MGGGYPLFEGRMPEPRDAVRRDGVSGRPPFENRSVGTWMVGRLDAPLEVTRGGAIPIGRLKRPFSLTTPGPRGPPVARPCPAEGCCVVG